MELVDVAQAADLIRPPALRMCTNGLKHSHGRGARTSKADQLDTALITICAKIGFMMVTQIIQAVKTCYEQSKIFKWHQSVCAPAKQPLNHDSIKQLMHCIA